MLGQLGYEWTGKAWEKPPKPLTATEQATYAASERMERFRKHMRVLNGVDAA